MIQNEPFFCFDTYQASNRSRIGFSFDPFEMIQFAVRRHFFQWRQKQPTTSEECIGL